MQHSGGDHPKRPAAAASDVGPGAARADEGEERGESDVGPAPVVDEEPASAPAP